MNKIGEDFDWETSDIVISDLEKGIGFENSDGILEAFNKLSA